MKSTTATAEDKKARAAQAEAYKKADYAYVIKCAPNGGGTGRMVKRGN